MENNWIDFKELRSKLDFEKVLTHYGVEPHVRNAGKGRQHSGICPLQKCKDRPRRKTFSANLDRRIWQCFCCRAGGNILDFIALMEGLDAGKKDELRKTAMMAKEKFLGEAKQKPPSTEKKTEQYSKVLVNEPLDFELKSLDATHPWFENMGLSKETVAHFGLGYCGRGWLKGRIAIPLHNEEGKLIGYAGRMLDERESTDKNPLYLFPKSRIHQGIRYEFDYSHVLYNGHTNTKAVSQLFVTTSIESVWSIWQRGYTPVIAPLGMGFTSETKIRIQAIATTDSVVICIVGKQPFAVNAFLSLAHCYAVRWYMY